MYLDVKIFRFYLHIGGQSIVIFMKSRAIYISAISILGTIRDAGMISLDIKLSTKDC